MWFVGDLSSGVLSHVLSQFVVGVGADCLG